MSNKYRIKAKIRELDLKQSDIQKLKVSSLAPAS